MVPASEHAGDGRHELEELHGDSVATAGLEVAYVMTRGFNLHRNDEGGLSLNQLAS